MQRRWAHTDLYQPSFDEYRRSSTRDPHTSRGESDVDRRIIDYVILGTMGSVALVGGKQTVLTVMNQFGPTKDIVEASKLEVNLSQIPEGKQITVKWNGKPVFIRQRTEAEIAKEQQVNISSLRDPQRDSDRALNPRWLVLIGVCTHLSCVPLPFMGDYGGYYCPCHGSHYDASGRIRRGPAPTNMVIPPYQFLNESTLVLG